MKHWAYNHIYIPLVILRDRNHYKDGFTWKGHIWQFLVVVYGKMFFGENRQKDNGNS